MTLNQWLSQFQSTNLEFKTAFMDEEFIIRDDDRVAAWTLYVQLMTRITTQELKQEEGDEETALKSVHSLFETTRTILTEKGRTAQSFSIIAISILNQVIRPFTAKWHPLSMTGAFNNPEDCLHFRQELRNLQPKLQDYASMLASIADAEKIDKVLRKEMDPYTGLSND